MIRLEGVSKYFGDFPAIIDISFHVEAGEVLGFLGPNGAGKTTTMKIVTGFMPPTGGRATVAGYDVVTHSLEARRHIGYMPETVPLYPEMTVEDYLTFMGRIRGMSRRWIRKRIGDVIDVCHLGDYQTSHISKLSKGYRQRVGIAQAILHEPDVLVLDEPTLGIDPIQVVETRQLIKELGGPHTLLMSSHILPEVSEICGRVAIIHEGRIVAIDRPEDLASRLRGVEHLELDVRGPQTDVSSVLSDVEGVSDIGSQPGATDDYSTYTVASGTGTDVRARLAAAVVREGWALLRLEATAMSLEEIFLRLTTSEEAEP